MQNYKKIYWIRGKSAKSWSPHGSVPNWADREAAGVSNICGWQGRHEKREETTKGRVKVRKLGQNQSTPNQRPATEMIRRVWTMLGQSGGAGI